MQDQMHKAKVYDTDHRHQQQQQNGMKHSLVVKVDLVLRLKNCPFHLTPDSPMHISLN